MAVINTRLRTWGLLALVNIFWAAQYPAYRVVSATVSVATLNFWTFLIAVIVLAPALLLERRRRPRSGKSIRAHAGLDFLWLAALGLIPPSVVLAWGIDHSSASNASILSLTIPVLMVLMGVWMLKERPGRFVLVSLVLALLGTALISWDDVVSGNFSGRMMVGNLAVFLSGAGAAFYNAYCKKLLDRYSSVEILLYGDIVAMVLCALISLAIDPVPFYHVTAWSSSAWIAVFVLGAIVWGAAMLIWLRVLDQLELGQISVSVYMLPVFGVLLSALTLGEHVGVMQCVGGIIVLSSAYLSSAPPPARHQGE